MVKIEKDVKKLISYQQKAENMVKSRGSHGKNVYNIRLPE